MAKLPDRRWLGRLPKFGLLVGGVLVVASLTPACGDEGSEATSDPGRALASAAGCDVNRSEVPMIQAELDYTAEPGKPVGERSVEEAVTPLYRELGENGATFSAEELAATARSASTAQSPIEVRLPGAIIYVEHEEDGSYLATSYVQCA